MPQDDASLFALSVVEKLQEAGFQAYFVGGCVRDLVMRLKPGDYDIATSAKPEETLILFPDADQNGLIYGILKVGSGGRCAQVGVFRQDHPVSDGRRPKRIYFAGMKEDALRRDFTINAMYFDPIAGELLDPLDGMSDVKNKMLRVIGEPRQRFYEDHLRMLRAVRFAARFNYQIDAETEKALKQGAAWLEKISPDRVRDELSRSFCEGNKVYCLELLHNLGILPIFWDIFLKEEYSLYTQIKENLSLLNSIDALEIWTSFFLPWHSLPEWRNEVEKGMVRLNFSRKWKKAIYRKIRSLEEEDDY